MKVGGGPVGKKGFNGRGRIRERNGVCDNALKLLYKCVECQTTNRFSLSHLSLYVTQFLSTPSLISLQVSDNIWMYSILLLKSPWQPRGTFLVMAKTKLFIVICLIWNIVLNNWNIIAWNKALVIFTYSFTQKAPSTRVGKFPCNLSGPHESAALKRDRLLRCESQSQQLLNTCLGHVPLPLLTETHYIILSAYPCLEELMG